MLANMGAHRGFGIEQSVTDRVDSARFGAKMAAEANETPINLGESITLLELLDGCVFDMSGCFHGDSVLNNIFIDII